MKQLPKPLKQRAFKPLNPRQWHLHLQVATSSENNLIAKTVIFALRQRERFKNTVGAAYYGHG